MRKQSLLGAFTALLLATCFFACKTSGGGDESAPVATITGVSIGGEDNIASEGTVTLSAIPAFSQGSGIGSSKVVYKWGVFEGAEYGDLQTDEKDSSKATLTGKNTTETARKVTIYVTAEYKGETKSAEKTVTIAAKTSVPDPGTDPVEVNYTVKRFLQPVSLSEDKAEYEEQKNDEQTLTGNAGNQTTVEAKDYAGFSMQTIEQQTINPDGSTVVSVYYDRKEVTLTFDSQGGSDVDSVSGKFGTEVRVPDNPIKEGFYFGGWNPSFTVFPAVDSTCVAVWLEPGTHSISYLDSDGKTPINGVKPLTFKETEDVDLSKSVPAKSGYTFKGWTLPDSSDLVVSWKAGEKTSDVKLFASWTENSLGIKASAPEYGGDVKDFLVIDKNDLEKITLADTNAEHKSFVWYVDDEKQSENGNAFAINVSDEKYKAGSYTVMLVADGKYSATVQVLISK